MSEILFLAHRIPYPPDKGDKIRSYHLLRALAEKHTVHLGTFIDDPADWAHAETVQSLCRGEVCIRAITRPAARLRSAAGLLTGEPLSLAHYRDRVLGRWIQDLAVRRRLNGVFVFSSSMGQYVTRLPRGSGGVRVIDFCDVDSDKWRQYAASHRCFLKLVYAREARTLARIESRYVRQFDASIVISEAEARILRTVSKDAADRVSVVPNGVDTEYFDPRHLFPSPFPRQAIPIVFTGAMDYYANVDGVQWFAREALPVIRQQIPQAVFAVVGANPTADVKKLGTEPGILVTGKVPDVRPFLAHAAVVIVPLRIARGVQNKVLEALAMNRPVVATESAMQGIPAADDAGVEVVTDVGGMAAAVVRCLMEPAGRELYGRRFVQMRYAWAAQTACVLSLLDPVSARPDVKTSDSAVVA